MVTKSSTCNAVCKRLKGGGGGSAFSLTHELQQQNITYSEVNGSSFWVFIVFEC